MFCANAGATFAAGRYVLILPAALLCVVGSASGQDTVYIGGSGQTGVVVDMGALEHFEVPLGAGQGLRHPGVADGGLAPVTLRPPDGAPVTASARVEAPAPEPAPPKTAAKLELPAADATIAPKLETSEPPEPPEPIPDTVLAKAPEEMSADERAVEKERNKNSVSSTSFADEAALMDDDGDAAAMEAEPAPAEAKAEPEPAPETEVAALAPAVAPTAPGDTMQIEFGAGESALPQSAQAPLASLAAALGKDETLRLQLKAYAGGDADSASHARRLSLSRALAVRSELIEQGVRSTRIDVRALGNKSENGSSDRVDVILVQR